MTNLVPDVPALLSAKAHADLAYTRTHGDAKWEINNSSWESYINGVTFLSGGLTVPKILALQGIQHDVGLDLAGGSAAVALRTLLELGIIDKGLVTNFQDRHFPEVDDNSRLTHIDGDLTLARTWRQIEDWKDRVVPNGIGLALHRPLRTLQDFPATVYADWFNTLTDMLKPDGVIFTQIPVSLHERDSNAIFGDLANRADVARVLVSDSPVSMASITFRHAIIIKTGPLASKNWS